MKPFFTKRKAMALISCAALTSLAIGATFAWTSLNSQKVNEWYGNANPDVVTGPGGSLHDDHDNSKPDDPRKDVYVENWGEKPLFVRVKLSEYMEIGENAGSVTEDPGSRELYRNTDNASTPLLSAMLTSKNSKSYLNFLTHAPEGTNLMGCEIGTHEYWRWVLGNTDQSAQKVYKPATEDEKKAATNANGSVVTDNTDYSYETDVPGGGKTTLNGRVITMDEWIHLSGPDAYKDYWAYDKDGWAYWSNVLRPGNATSLLVHRVEKTDKSIEGQYYYAINVRAQMADMGNVFETNADEPTEDDVTNWVTGDKGVEKASDEAIELLRTAYKTAVDEGLYGNIEVTEEELDNIFVPYSRPSAEE